MAHEVELVRNCHSDIRLHMSYSSFCELLWLLSFAKKYIRAFEGEDSFEYSVFSHWYSSMTDVSNRYEHSFNCDNPIVKVFCSAPR